MDFDSFNDFAHLLGHENAVSKPIGAKSSSNFAGQALGSVKRQRSIMGSTIKVPTRFGATVSKKKS